MAGKVLQTQSLLCIKKFPTFLTAPWLILQSQESTQPSPLAPLQFSSPCALPTLTYKTQLHLVVAHFTSFIQNQASEPKIGEISWWLSSVFRVLIKIPHSPIYCNICALFFQEKLISKFDHIKDHRLAAKFKRASPASGGSSICTVLMESNQKLGLKEFLPQLNFQDSCRGKKE